MVLPCLCNVGSQYPEELVCLEQTIQQHPGTHEPFASKKPQMEVALHVTLECVPAGVGAVSACPSGFCTHSFVPVNSALLWGSFQLGAVLPVHPACCEKPSKESKLASKIVSIAVGDQERAALLGCS